MFSQFQRTNFDFDLSSISHYITRIEFQIKLGTCQIHLMHTLMARLLVWSASEVPTTLRTHPRLTTKVDLIQIHKERPSLHPAFFAFSIRIVFSPCTAITRSPANPNLSCIIGKEDKCRSHSSRISISIRIGWGVVNLHPPPLLNRR